MEMLNKHSSRRFQLKETVFSLLFTLVPRGILTFYVSFKYYHAPVHVQLNRNATSILCQMQSEHRDKEPTERHAQERKGCGQGDLPQLRNLSLPNRKGLSVTDRLSNRLNPHFLISLALKNAFNL